MNIRRWISGLLFAAAFLHGTAAMAQLEAVEPPPQEVVEHFRLDPFYKKFISADGIPVLASEKVSDYAMREAAYLIRLMLKGKEEIRDAMVANRTRFVIMAVDEFTTTMPEHSDLKPSWFWDRRARGLGATRARPAVSCGEENILRYNGDPYLTESILIHEFAHAMHQMGIETVDPTFNSRLQKALDDAKSKGLWATKYASNNRDEYFAEAVQSWFNTNREEDHDHNHVNTREELKEYDPAVAALVQEIFGDDPWRYTPPSQRTDEPHLQGYDHASSPTFAWPADFNEWYEWYTREYHSKGLKKYEWFQSWIAREGRRNVSLAQFLEEIRASQKESPTDDEGETK